MDERYYWPEDKLRNAINHVIFSGAHGLNRPGIVKLFRPKALLRQFGDIFRIKHILSQRIFCADWLKQNNMLRNFVLRGDHIQYTGHDAYSGNHIVEVKTGSISKTYVNDVLLQPQLAPYQAAAIDALYRAGPRVVIAGRRTGMATVTNELLRRAQANDCIDRVIRANKLIDRTDKANELIDRANALKDDK